MNIVIFGTRKFNNYLTLKNIIDNSYFYKHNNINCVISGAAKGADTLGEQWAKEKGIEVMRMPAEWDKYGKAAGHIRNKEMAEKADCAIGFWDGSVVHSGTNNMINICEKLKVPMIVYRIDTQELTQILYEA